VDLLVNLLMTAFVEIAATEEYVEECAAGPEIAVAFFFEIGLLS